MKKLNVTIMLAFLCVLLFTVPAMASDQEKVPLNLYVNGIRVDFPDQRPYIDENNRTLVPVRAPMEAAGATVTWNDTTRQATVAKDDKTAVFTIGSKQYTVNGEIREMDTEAQIAGSRTVFPIRFVAEAIGLTVTWDEKTQTVGITAPAASENNPEVKPGTTQPEETAPSTQNQKPMTSLTPEAKARLMAYPYPTGVEIYSAMVVLKEESITLGYSATHPQEVMQSFLDQKSLIKSNQKFYFDSDLCYSCTGAFGDRVRGVLQTKNSDGSITEQDVEFGFAYGTHFVSEGETPRPSHLLEGNDFIVLSPPIKI